MKISIILLIVYIVFSILSLIYSYCVVMVGEHLYYKKELPYSQYDGFAFFPKVVKTWRLNQYAIVWLQTYKIKKQNIDIIYFYVNKLGIFSITF